MSFKTEILKYYQHCTCFSVMFFALCIVFFVITYRNCRRSIMEFYKLQMHRLCPWPVIVLCSLVLCWVDKLIACRFALFVCGVHLLLSTVGLVALFCFFLVCLSLYCPFYCLSFFLLQSHKQLKQQQEEKTNKAPVKQRLNQNKFYVSVSMQRCATDAQTRKNHKYRCWNEAWQKSQPGSLSRLPSRPQYCSFPSVLSTRATDFSWSNHSLAHPLHNYLPADITIYISR